MTSATFRLQPIPELTTVVTIRPGAGQPLATFIDSLIRVKLQGLLPENLHLSNKNRRLSVVAPLLARERNSTIQKETEAAQHQMKEEWIATASINATREVTDALCSRLQSELAGLAFLSRDTSDSALTKDGTLERATKGIRSNPSGVPSDDSILSLGYGQNDLFKGGPIESNSGALFVVPLLPCDGKEVERALHIIEREFSSNGFNPYITLNLIEGACFEAVVNLTFERDNSLQKKSAMRVIRRTFTNLERNGFPPQRMSIFQMDLPQKISASHQACLQQLKGLFDPHNIISRGRYEIRGTR